MSTSYDLFSSKALYASVACNSQNLGMKDNSTVELASVFPITQLGIWKFSVVYTNENSLLGTYDFYITNKVSVHCSFWLIIVILCETELKKVTLRLVFRSNLKVQLYGSFAIERGEMIAGIYKW